MDIDEKKLKRRLDAAGNPTQLLWNPQNWKLSQSGMKAYQQTMDGRLCPIVFREHCLTFNLISESGDAARRGQYFEYLATGAAPAYGDAVPEPERYQKSGTVPSTGVQYVAGDIKPDWLLPVKQAESFQRYMDQYGMRIIARGAKIARDDAHGNIDIIVQVDRDRWEEVVLTFIMIDMGSTYEKLVEEPAWEDCQWRDENGFVHRGCIVIDLKYSSEMYEKWRDTGWDIEQLGNKRGLMLQAKHYHWLTGGLPFFFWVFSSTDEDSRIIRILFSPYVLDAHKSYVRNSIKLIKAQMSMPDPFQPDSFILGDSSKYVPTLKDCHACPLNSECKFKATLPRIYAVQPT